MNDEPPKPKKPSETKIQRLARKQAEKDMASTIDLVLRGLNIRGKKIGLQRQRMIAEAGENAATQYAEDIGTPSTFDYGKGATPERIAKADGDVEPAILTEPDGSRVTTLRMRETLDTCLSHRNITFDMYNAGNLFIRDYYNSGRSGIGAVDLERPTVDHSTGSGSVADIRLEASARFDAALRHVGPCHGRVLQCLLTGARGINNGEPETLEAHGRRRFGYNTRRDATVSSIAVLRLALERLADHYFTRINHPIRGSIREGYRPTISADNPTA